MVATIRSYILTSLILIFLFLVTFYIRYSYLTYKVPSIEQGNIMLLSSLENFFKRGIVNSYFSPVATWANKGDRNLSYYSQVQENADNNYYISHPPFTFLLTYSIFKIFHLTPNEYSLQILGLILHLIGAFFVYLIVLEYFDKKGLVLYFPAIISYVTYLFIPVMMNLHLFHIFCETFVQPFWIIGIYSALLIFKERERKVTRFELIFLGFTVFLMIYTEWLGVFFAFSMCFVCFYYSHKDRKYISVFNTTVISGALALLLIVIQYSRINGFWFFIDNIYTKLILQNGYFGDQINNQGLSLLNADSYILLGRQLNDLMGGFGYLFLFMFLATIFITIRKKNFTLKLSQDVRYMVMLSLVPPVLYFLVFFNSSLIHYIYIAKFAVPISIFSAIIYKKLILSFKQTTAFVIVFGVVKVVVILVSVYLFLTKTPFDNNYTYLSDVSEIIQNNSNTDETIFINIHTQTYNPLVFLSYESKRNLMYANDLYQAKKLLKDNNKSKGVFFTFNQKKKFYSINHFNNNQDAELFRFR